MDTAGLTLGRHLQNEVPAPILLNTWKHHAGALRQRIAATAAAAELPDLAAQLAVVGTELMDLYVGALTPVAVGETALALLRDGGRLDRAAFGAWVAEGGGYQVLTFAADDSRWVVRSGEAERYVHLHPARWAPQTRRVRANVLKTAVAVLAYVNVHGGDPRHVRLVNHVRTTYLGLSKMRALTDDQGLGAVLDVLKG